MGAAFFDIDGTLLQGESQKSFLSFLRRRGLIKNFQYLKLVGSFLLYKIGILHNPDKIKEIMGYAASLLSGISVDELSRISKEFFRNDLYPRIFPGIIAEIERHKKDGRSVVLISNALDPIVSQFADALGANEFICSRLGTRDGRYSGVLSSMMYGDNKEEAAKLYLSSKNISPDDSWAYSNHHSDIPLLMLVKHAVAVNPTNKLRSFASRKGWIIRDI